MVSATVLPIFQKFCGNFYGGQNMSAEGLELFLCLKWLIVRMVTIIHLSVSPYPLWVPQHLEDFIALKSSNQAIEL